jgi:hypothetical protein
MLFLLPASKTFNQGSGYTLETKKTRACFWVFVITAWWFARGITTLKIPMILGVTLKPFVNMLHAKKGQTMKNTFMDYLAAIALGLMLCIGALQYFDVLVK